MVALSAVIDAIEAGLGRAPHAACAARAARILGALVPDDPDVQRLLRRYRRASGSAGPSGTRYSRGSSTGTGWAHWTSAFVGGGIWNAWMVPVPSSETQSLSKMLVSRRVCTAPGATWMARNCSRGAGSAVPLPSKRESRTRTP